MLTCIYTSVGNREVLKGKIRAADSIIALYDVTRPETLENLNNEWLPLVRDIWFGEKSSIHSNKAVVVCATKLDLLHDIPDDNYIHEEEAKMRQLVSSYPFIFSTCRASAKLLNVDGVFYYADLIVTFPLGPLFDSIKSDFTIPCKRALVRLCRIFDNDKDGLLSDHELCTLQYTCFDNSLNDEDIIALKKQIHLVISGGIRYNKVTFQGFMGYIKLFIEKSHTQTPWTIMRRYNYDDNLNLVIPAEVTNVPLKKSHEITILSSKAYHFLLKLAINTNNGVFNYINDYLNESLSTSSYDHKDISGSASTQQQKESSSSSSVKESMITMAAIKSMLAVIDTSATPTPWNSNHSVYFTDRMQDDEASADDNIYLLSDMNHIDRSKAGSSLCISIDAWISHWEMLAVLKPLLTQKLLFQIGYADQSDYGVIKIDRLSNNSSTNSNASNVGSSSTSSYSGVTPTNNAAANDDIRSIVRTTYRVCILGENHVGKTSLLLKLAGLISSDAACVSENDSVMSIIDKENNNKFIHCSNCQYVVDKVDGNNLLINIIITEVPSSRTEEWISKYGDSCDAAILMFSCSPQEKASFEICTRIEQLLPHNVPRFYMANKSDIIPSSLPSSPTRNNADASANQLTLAMSASIVNVHQATVYLDEHQLQPLQCISLHTNSGIDDAMKTLVDILLDPSRGIPVGMRRKKGYSMLMVAIVAGAAAALCGSAFLYSYKGSHTGVAGTFNKFIADLKKR